jgi:membrane protein
LHGVNPSRFGVATKWQVSSMKFWWNVLRDTVKGFLEDKAVRLAAALAYYSIFSLAPLLIIIIALAGFFLEESTVRQQVHGQLSQLLGPESTQTVESMLAARKVGSTTIATILGVGALLLGASGLFGQLQDALNTVWEVKARPGRSGLWAFVRDRFLSLTMVLGLGFLLLISMVLTTAVEAMATGVGRMFPIPGVVVVGLSLIVSFLVVTTLFMLIFKVLPDVRVPWKVGWIGGLATAVLFTAGKWGLGYYLGQESTRSAYGAAGSVVIVLLWIYYSSLILLFGAEFTQIYAEKKGLPLQPSEYAEPVTPEDRAQEGLESEPASAGTAPAFARRKEPGAAIHGPLTVLQENSRAHPWRSVFLAWGFGILTGWIFRRKANASLKL